MAYSYDAAGNLATMTNALGQVTQYQLYDAHGMPTRIVDANGVATTLAYDARQRLTSRATAGETTTYTYDGIGQLTRVTAPDASFVAYQYDGAKRLVGIDDSFGNAIDYTLDAMGNRTAEQVFDPANALRQARSREFDVISRLKKDIGAATQTTSYVRDDNGNVTGMTDPLGKATTSVYDALDRLTTVTDPGSGITRYGYNALDQLVSVTDPRNNTTNYTIDALGNLKQQVSPDTGTTVNTFDAAGNIATSTDARGKVAVYPTTP